jgi:cysteinyl-tRNA synthetase
LKEYSPEELRWYFATYHYREPVTMTESSLKRARNDLRALSENMENFRKTTHSDRATRNRRLNRLTSKLEKDFRNRMNDDFDTPTALRALIGYIAHISKVAGRQTVDTYSKESAEAAVDRICNVIGIDL